MGRPTAGWGSINCAGAGQPGRVWQARTPPGVAMLPGEAGINVRKTARYASKDCDPLQERKKIAHGASRVEAPRFTEPRPGAKDRGGAIFRPLPGALPHAPHSHGSRRGLLSCALRAGEASLRTPYAPLPAKPFGIRNPAPLKPRALREGFLSDRKSTRL